MSKVNLKVSLELNFYNEGFIGGGKGSGEIDSFVIKDSNNKPYIPGSTIKGRTRYNMSMLLNTFNKIGDFCGFNIDNDNKSDCNCDVCKLFGGQGNKSGLLYFDDLKLKESNKYINDYSVRAGILVSRYTKQVKDQALFKFETMGLGGEQKFCGYIEGYIEEEDKERYSVLLFTAISMIKTIGGNQSRGIGWLGEGFNVKIYIDNKEISNETLAEWGEIVEV